jgi:hypothetical protein
MPAPITAETIKSCLGIAHHEDDARLAIIAAGTLAAVEGHCSRSFSGVVEDRVEIVDGGGKALHLSRLPVTEISEIQDLLQAEAFDTDLIRIEAEIGLVFRSERANWYGRANDNRWQVTYSHGYETCPADVVEVLHELATAKYERPDPSVSSKSEGGQSVSYGDAWAMAKKKLRRYVRPRC